MGRYHIDPTWPGRPTAHTDRTLSRRQYFGATVMIGKDTFMPHCTASLLDPLTLEGSILPKQKAVWVLTAAHCIFNFVGGVLEPGKAFVMFDIYALQGFSYTPVTATPDNEAVSTVCAEKIIVDEM